MSGKVPRLLLCAPHSGGGKTTVSCCLLQCFANRGLRPVAFKCGPDYIDPMFHSEIIGVPSRNLDLFFLGREGTRRSLRENGEKGGVALIEGVMGYYDGIAMSTEASAWALARETETPAVLVLEARGLALSAAAAVEGFRRFREPSCIRGVILNRCAPMLYPRLAAAITEETGLPVFGYLPELPDCALESRHLGLVTAAEVEDLREKLARLARQGEKSLDIAGLLALAKSAPPLPAAETPLPPPVAGHPRIAVARDEAFCFYYADALELLERLGAALVDFSPLKDPALPAGCAGLYLGGGYPETHARALSENASMRRSIRTAITGGLPTIAECGGFLYLHDRLEDMEGEFWPMCGVIAAEGYRTPRLSRFGYVTLTTEKAGLLGPAGTVLPGHEFHYWDSRDPGDGLRAEKPQSDRKWRCGHLTETLYAGFPHFHFSAVPDTARRFVEACARYAAGNENLRK